MRVPMDLIVAVNEDWGIGKDGTQSIVIREDRKRFREITGGGAVIVGRRTLGDFPNGKPLKNRLNIVLTHSQEPVEGACTAGSVREVQNLLLASGTEKAFVCGGASVYEQFLPWCRYAYVTKIFACPSSDRFLEDLDASPDWVLREQSEKKEQDGVTYAFLQYENIRNQER